MPGVSSRCRRLIHGFVVADVETIFVAVRVQALLANQVRAAQPIGDLGDFHFTVLIDNPRSHSLAAWERRIVTNLVAYGVIDLSTA